MHGEQKAKAAVDSDSHHRRRCCGCGSSGAWRCKFVPAAATISDLALSCVIVTAILLAPVLTLVCDSGLHGDAAGDEEWARITQAWLNLLLWWRIFQICSAARLPPAMAQSGWRREYAIAAVPWDERQLRRGDRR